MEVYLQALTYYVIQSLGLRVQSEKCWVEPSLCLRKKSPLNTIFSENSLLILPGITVAKKKRHHPPL